MPFFFFRLERACDGVEPDTDFRVAALRQAAGVLLEGGPQRVKRMAMLLSDPTEEQRDVLDRKAALVALELGMMGRRD